MTGRIIANLDAIISDIGIMIAKFTQKDYEAAGAAYGDVLILAVGKLPPRLTLSPVQITAALDNLHLLVPHPDYECKDA